MRHSSTNKRAHGLAVQLQQAAHVEPGGEDSRLTRDDDGGTLQAPPMLSHQLAQQLRIQRVDRRPRQAQLANRPIRGGVGLSGWSMTSSMFIPRYCQLLAMISRSTVVAKLPAVSVKLQVQHIAAQLVFEIAHPDARRTTFRIHALGVNHGQRLGILRGGPLFEREHLAAGQRFALAHQRRRGMNLERGAALRKHSVGRLHREHTAAAIEVRNIPWQQPVPAPLLDTRGEDGVENDAACRGQHEALAVPWSAAPPAPGTLLRRAQHLLEVSGIATEALRAEIVRHSAACDRRRDVRRATAGRH